MTAVIVSALTEHRHALREALARSLGWNWPAVPDEHIPGSDVLVDDVLDEFLPKVAAVLVPHIAAERADAAAVALEDAAAEQIRLSTAPAALKSRAVQFKRMLFAAWLDERAETYRK